MTVPSYFISCDWGTTNFRVRLVETETLKICWESTSNQGVKKTFEAFRAQSEQGQEDFYGDCLLEMLERLPEEHQHHMVVASGMASSNIGLYELPYAEMPFDKNGNSFEKKSMTLRNGQELLLISGIRSTTGMMRGEEVQAIGLEEQLAPYREGILLLPGTHSKHISYRQGSFYALKNYMTGELFEVLGQRSILANSIIPEKWNAKGKKAFLEGFQLGVNGDLTSSLLHIRARDVVEGKGKKDNYFRLSGLLIGDELSYLKNGDENIFLSAPKSLFDLYSTGLETFKAPDKLILLNDAIFEQALLQGQKKILLSHARQ